MELPKGFFRPFSDPAVMRKKARFRKRDCQVRYINWGSSSHVPMHVNQCIYGHGGAESRIV